LLQYTAPLGSKPTSAVVSTQVRPSGAQRPLLFEEQLIPIPGTSSIAHLEENVGAAEIHLTDAEYAGLSA